MENLGILIPCKALTRGKSRLASVLSDESRHQLCRSFLLRSLELARSIIIPDHIGIVSDDPEVLSIGQSCGALSVLDTGNGLNKALEDGRLDLLKARPCVKRLLVMPIDLPLCTSSAVKAFAKNSEDVALAADRSGVGTNMICLSPKALNKFSFRYGNNSLASHRQEAADQRLSMSIVDEFYLGFDIDEPDHYKRWIEGAANGELAA
ncbi:2-phospho-L-lactate guanylyltransferase [Bradyrhizobium canariense]|jgi:2-phospho-L-lactate guanylyltransferase|uniref:2-phospho-L-lactate guanylyltransferase n=1 Tax=Bradyrhizobium canariense TaxID=255045 RepID=A0A1H1YPU6_9BRAD|nr:2-phospho-L-lactate guanylyltransferase [Bradyrhizobium canariense]SDT23498.1 2-phospho-L-lactate guanylyltransferase [Bradyrhizobium canariense]